MQIDNVKTFFAVAASVVTILGGGYTFLDRLGFHWTRPVLTWAPEHFMITSGSVDEPFRAVVAREKHRDDCEVTSFTIHIQDSELEVFQATPSSTTFSGPASDKIDKFAYKFYIREEDYGKISLGRAKFMGTIKYMCPEGEQIIAYPDNIYFEIYSESTRPF